MPRPKRYPDFETYRKEYYNKLPETKEKNKIYNQKWKSKPEVRARLRKYNREYMKKYWVANPVRYKLQKLRIAELNRARNERNRSA